MSPGCIPALIASTWVGVNGTAFLEKNEVTHIICEYTIQMFRHNRARVVGWKGRIFSAADVNCKIGLRHWPTNWSVPVLEKPGSCLVLFFYCLFAYPRDTIVINSFKCFHAFQIELKFESVGFSGEDKTWVPGENPFGARMRTNNKLNPQMASTPGNKAAPHWWEASALITGPSLLHPPPPPLS